MIRQDDAAIPFLERLLALSERSPDRSRPASASPDYDSLPRADAIARFQAQLTAAQRSGAVVLRYGKRERSHLIERVTVKDAVVLARHLGRNPSPVTAGDARRSLSTIVDNGEAWLVQILDEMEERWSRGEQTYRLGSTDLDAAREFLTLLRAISDGGARGLDARTFSLRITGDTKAFDRHTGRLLSVLTRRFNETAADVIWAHIGLDRYPHPVHLHGPIVAESPDGMLVDGRGKPFASIHPEMLPFLRTSGVPSYILTIENYASFNRHVRELEDGGLVFYTGGFASAGVISLLTWVLNNLDEAIPFFHWGDIDPGGLRIFRYFEETLPRAPQPHLMNRPLAEAHGKAAPCDTTLSSIAQSSSAVAALAQWLARGGEIRHLEQEAINPTTPHYGAARVT